MTDLLVNLPFSGLYESMWSNELDHCKEREAEYLEEKQEEEGVPLELRLTSADFSSIIFDVADYGKIHAATASSAADATIYWFDDALGFKTGMRFESMTSPKYYNFETDRLFAHIPAKTVRKLFAASKREKHARLAKRIEDRFTSYDGFCSSYPNQLSEWLAKPLMDWDHNELGTLLEALGDWSRDSDWEVLERVPDGLYEECSAGIDWTKLEAAVADKRAELEHEMRANDPDWVAPPYRCDRTLDLFQDARS